MLRHEQPEEQQPQVTIKQEVPANTSLVIPVVQKSQEITQQTQAVAEAILQQKNEIVRSDVIAELDARIGRASSVNDMEALLKIRAELLKQNAVLEEKRHGRRMDYWQMLYKAAMTLRHGIRRVSGQQRLSYGRFSGAWRKFLPFVGQVCDGNADTSVR